ncbi:Thioesterase/thiol ester dehydrase-isomerase [Auriculariales sp. MPI-PUGE-AT-0066]|nr:Thioesterase/thiol ester dehydrase-isomerase [Auriculariales sp. MPI-PUGE-AT-0066]
MGFAVLGRRALHLSRAGHAWPGAVNIATPGAAEAVAYAREHGFDPESFLEQPISWGDQDSMRHLNNVRYSRFIETGRMKWLASIGNELGGSDRARLFMEGRGVSLILKSIEVSFKRPVTYPDTLLVAHRPHNLQDTQLNLASIVYSYGQQRLVTTGDCVCVWYDYDQLKKTAVPVEIANVVNGRVKSG